MVRVFRHYVPKYMLLLAALDVLVLIVAAYMGIAISMQGLSTEDGTVKDMLFPAVLVFAVVMLGTMTSMGLYWRGLRSRPAEHVLRLIGSIVIGGVFGGLLITAILYFPITQKVIEVVIALALAGVVATRLIHYVLSDSEALKSRVIVLGAGKKAIQLEMLRRKSDWRGYYLLGYAPLSGEVPIVKRRNLRRLDGPLTEFVKAHDIDEIIVAIDDRRQVLPMDELLECKMMGVDVVDIAAFFERRAGRLKIDLLRPGEMVFADGFSHTVRARVGKRLFDIIASSSLLLVGLPVMLVTALAIVIESKGRGPIFYSQERIGKNGVPFRVLKFRSMRVDAEKDGMAQWAKKEDNRVTVVGRIIRKYRIDELPQLINVLRGDMSFVGPRPERPEFVNHLAQEIPFYNLRHTVKPGITGWAQISYPYGDSTAASLAKLEYDLYYIKNYSYFLDFNILLQTAQAVLWARGGR